nr:MAG TPA: hypothetical protein [Caudoviricetes sp.]
MRCSSTSSSRPSWTRPPARLAATTSAVAARSVIATQSVLSRPTDLFSVSGGPWLISPRPARPHLTHGDQHTDRTKDEVHQDCQDRLRRRAQAGARDRLCGRAEPAHLSGLGGRRRHQGRREADAARASHLQQVINRQTNKEINMSDQAQPTLTFNALSKLEKSAAPTPFTFGIGNKVIAFPDPLSLTPEAAEKFMAAMESSKAPTQMIRTWLTAEDADLLLSKLNMRQLGILIRQASEHYQGMLGDAGEGSASTTD